MFDFNKCSECGRKLFSVAMVFLILFLAFAGIKQLVSAMNDWRNGGVNNIYQTVSFTGEGKIKSAPDTAKVEIGLVTEGPDSITVQNENSKKMNAVISYVKGRGVKDEDVKTSNYSLSPKYSYTKGKSTLIGYTLNQMITVTVRDLTKVGEILDGSVSAGANEITSVSLFTDKPEELKNKAREEAVNQAKEKAKAASKSAGFRLGHLVGFSENFSGEPRMYYEKMGMGIGGGDASSVVPSPQIEPGSQEISVSITLTYLIK